MGTNGPTELIGTAVAKTDDVTSQLAAYEQAMKRLHHSATVRGYFIGEPVVHTEKAPGREGDYLCIILVAPVLATGTDAKTTASIWDTPIQAPVDEPGDTPAG